MNNKIFALVILLFLIAALFIAVGCDKLVTQVNNNNIYDTTMGQYCVTCHSDEDNLILRPKGQWENSRHASPDLIQATIRYNETNYLTSQCGPQCHTNEGFIRYLDNGSIQQISKPSAIGCFTCHLPHSGNFGAWNIDSLRGLSDEIDLGNFNYYSMGKSNMCINCHKAVKIPTFSNDPLTNVKLDSIGVDGPHSSNQANVLIGYGGVRFGSTTIANSHETVKTLNGCLACHYGVGEGYAFGGHTFKLLDHSSGEQYLANCLTTSCHSGSRLITEFYSSTDTLLTSIQKFGDSLGGLLIDYHILTGDDDDSTSFYTDSIVPTDAAKILFNYLLYKKDHSRGIHNANYIYTLLKESVARWDSIPKASFEILYDTICVGVEDTFTNLSSGSITETEWAFGDNSDLVTGTGKIDAVHTFNTSGTFQVTLTITGIAGKKSVTKLIKVNQKPGAAFTATPQTATLGDIITFTDHSTSSPVSWLWSFGDGLGSSQTKDTTYTFTTSGEFIVWLKVTNDCGVDSTADTITITPPALRKQ